MIAFQYPYVLAFEPTFVEIRNVETGSMSQVIQGNNLRCLFADTPPSMRRSRTSQSSFSSHNGSSLSHGSYASPSYSHNGRASLPGAYGSSQVPMYPGQPPPPPAQPYGRAAGREEIIFVSDDRVLTLRMALPGQ